MLKFSQSGLTISLFFDNRRKTMDGTYPVKFNICYKRKRKYYNTGIYLIVNDWNVLFETKKRELINTRNTLENIFLKLKHNAESILSKGSFSFDVLFAMMAGTTDKTVSEAFIAEIKQLNNNEQIQTAESYQTSINSFISFAGKTILYKDITVTWLKSYEKYMLKQGRSITTVGIYLRNLRTIFNKAIKDGYADRALYPFGQAKDGKYEIPEGVGRKMALPIQQIKQIFEYDDDNETTVQYVDLWRFSYLCNGANMNDILRFKHGNIQGNEIFFLRGKTSRTAKKKREIVIFITPKMQQIIDKWGNKGKSPNSYIFPYLNGIDAERKKKAVIADVIKRINKRMKRVGEELGIPDITTYTARHSYATVLKRSGANIAFISESLGHADLKTTENYLASFETEERKKNAQLLTNF